MPQSQQRSTLNDLVYSAVFTALIIIFAFIKLPGTAGVPIVVQNVLFIFAALVLGPRRGFYVAALFIVLGLVGLPVLAGGRSVLASLGSPTIGYIVGYLLSPIIAGLISIPARGSALRTTLWYSAASICALLVQYVCGVIGLMIRSHLAVGAAVTSNLTFLPIDILKLVVIIIVALALRSAFPDLRPTRALTK